MRGVVQSAQMTDGHLFQMAFGSTRRAAGYGGLEIGIEQFVRIQLRAVGWQIKHFDGLRMLLQPLSDWRRMPACIAPSNTFQRTVPQLVTVEITDTLARRCGTRISGVCPRGA